MDYWRAAVPPTPLGPMLFAVPNGEYRDAVTAGKLTGISTERRAYLDDNDALQPFGLGVVPGVTDLVILTFPKRATWVEVKIAADKAKGRRVGTMNRQQRLFRERVVALGFDHVVVHSVDEFMTVLSGLGIPLRVRWWGPEAGTPGARVPPPA